MYRCKECTLLRVVTEGETCSECFENIRAPLTASSEWAAILSKPEVMTTDCGDMVYSWTCTGK